MEILTYVSLVVNGLIVGSLYALFGLGLNVAWNIGGVPNLAHGEFVAVGAYSMYFLVTAGVAIIPSAVGSVAIGLLLAAAFHRVLFRILGEKALLFGSILVTWGMSLALIAGMRYAFGSSFRKLNVLEGSVEIPLTSLRVPVTGALVLATAMVTSAILAGLLKFSGLGRRLRAVSNAPDLAASVGINVPVIRAAGFAMGAGLAIVAGVLVSMSYVFTPSIGQLYVLKGIAVVLVAGVGNLAMTWVWGAVLGVLEALVQFWLGGHMANFIAFALLGAALFIGARRGERRLSSSLWRRTLGRSGAAPSESSREGEFDSAKRPVA